MFDVDAGVREAVGQAFSAAGPPAPATGRKE
jgi:hypothetical protein